VVKMLTLQCTSCFAWPKLLRAERTALLFRLSLSSTPTQIYTGWVASMHVYIRQGLFRGFEMRTLSLSAGIVKAAATPPAKFVKYFFLHVAETMSLGSPARPRYTMVIALLPLGRCQRFGAARPKTQKTDSVCSLCRLSL
jgi:hypothetical protein